MRFKLQNTGDDWSFDLVSDADVLLLNGQTLTSRDAAVAAIRNTIAATRSKDNYRQNAAGKNSTFDLLDNNGNVLGSSSAFASPEAAQTAANNLREDALSSTDFPVDFTSTTTTTTTKRTLNKELPKPPGLEEMEGYYVFTRSSSTKKEGTELFEEDEKYWYYINNAEGKSILYGRGLESSSKRKTNVRSALRYGTKQKYYDLQEKNGQYYFVIRTPNKFEIARSPLFASTTDRQAAIDFLIANAESYKPEFAKETRKAKLDAQEYIFERQSTSAKVGFEEFKNEENKKHYFHLNDDDGKGLLFSQGYRGVKPRDTGLRSVIKNGTKRERYRIKQRNGNFHVVLLAANNQEIARSRPLANEAEGEAIITYLVGLMPNYVEQYGVVLVKATKTVTETDTFNIEMGMPAETVVAPVPAPAKKKDNYMSCATYNSAVGQSGFNKFQHESNSEYYFSYNDEKGETVWRSEGYSSQSSRDNGIESVKKNAPVEGRITMHKTKSGKFFAKLKAGNHQEIARTCYHEEEQNLALLLAPFMQDNGLDANAVLLGLIPAWGSYRSNWGWWKQQEEEKIALAAAAKAEQERIVAEKAAAEQERLRLAAAAKAKEEARLAAAAKAEQERIAAEKAAAEQERLRLAAEAKAKEEARLVAERKAEQERIAAAAKKEEETKMAAAAAAAAVALAASNKKKEEERIAAEKAAAEQEKLRLAAEAKAKEEARLAAERKAEQERIAATAKKEEEAKMAAAAAALVAANKKKEEERIATERAVAKAKEEARLAAERKAEQERIAAAAAKKEKDAKMAAAAAATAAVALAATNKKKEETRLAAERKAAAAKAAPVVMAQTSKTVKGAVPVKEVVETSSGRSWLWWLLPLLLIPLLFLLFRGCGGCGGCGAKKAAIIPPVEEVTTTTTPVEKVVPVDTVKPEPVKPLGPNGTELGFAKNGVAWNLANCLSNADCTLPAKYTMENTCFDKNGAKLPTAAYPTMADLAKVFKAYPNAKFTIFGNIDKAESEAYTGPYQDGNITLSAIRGRCIYKRLIKRGIAANRMTFEGQADTQNIGDACANRRVEIELKSR